jgi:TP901 family phage tail tape measure protein
MSDAKFTIELEKSIWDELKALRGEFGTLKTSVSTIEETSKKSFGSMSQYMKNVSFVSITQGLQNLTQGLRDISAPGLKFETEMANLSAITGFTGEKLDKLAASARQSGKDFGEDPAESVRGYGVLLSKLGPDIANNVDALDSMSRSVSTLAKTMGGDTNAAVDALTTGLLQFQVPLEDQAAAAAEMNKQMNVMAAASQQGAAAVPSISQALNVAGVAASGAKVSFEETNAAIQMLAKGGKEGAEAGTSLRNVMGILEQGRFMPKDTKEALEAAGVNIDRLSDKSLSFSDRLRELEKIQGDAALMNKLFGRENAAAASILVRSTDDMDKMTEAITGTATAHEMAATVMETTAEKQKRLQAQIDDFKVSIFNATGGLFAYMEPFSQLAFQLSTFAPLVNTAKTAFGALTKSKIAGAAATKIVTAATAAWNFVLNLNPIFLIIGGVAALGAGLYVLSNRLKTVTAEQRVANEVNKRATAAAADENAELNVMIDRLKRTKEGTDARKLAVQQLNEKYPDYLKNHDLENASLTEINELHKDIAKNIRKRAEEEVLAEIYKENYRKQLEMEMNGPSGWDTFWAKSASLASSTFSFGLSSAFETVTGEQIISAESIHQQKLANVREETEASLQMINQIGNKQKQVFSDVISAVKSGSISMLPKLGVDVTSTENKLDVNPNFNVSTPSATPGLSPEKPKSYAGAKAEMKNINVRIENVVKAFTINTNNMAQSASELQRVVAEALVGAVRDFEIAM